MSTKHGSHWLEREDFGDVTVVRFKTAQWDDNVIREVFEPIYTLVGIGRARLVLNLNAVEYLPSMALGKLVMLNRKVQAAEGRLALCNVGHAVDDVLEATRLKTLFESYPSEQDAVQSFATSG